MFMLTEKVDYNYLNGSLILIVNKLECRYTPFINIVNYIHVSVSENKRVSTVLFLFSLWMLWICYKNISKMHFKIHLMSLKI